jgi:anti-anti-sigma factor
MAIKIQSAKGHLSIKGEMTIYNAEAMKGKLLAPLEKGEDIEVDLSGVSEIDSAGLQLLALIKIEALARSKRASFVGHSKAVLDLIDLCGLDGFFGDPIWIQS